MKERGGWASDPGREREREDESEVVRECNRGRPVRETGIKVTVQEHAHAHTHAHTHAHASWGCRLSSQLRSCLFICT